MAGIRMGKAVLILNETPKNCFNCPCCFYELGEDWIDNGVCAVTGKSLNFIEDDMDGYRVKRKPRNCPLKPLEKEGLYEIIYQAYGLGKDNTYRKLRDTIDEILGEE